MYIESLREMLLSITACALAITLVHLFGMLVDRCGPGVESVQVVESVLVQLFVLHMWRVSNVPPLTKID